MPEAAAFRIELRPSRRELLVRGLARALTVAAAAACVGAWLLEPSRARLAVAVLAAAAAVSAFGPGRKERVGWLRIDAAGELRLGKGEAEQDAAVVYCDPRYLCLAAGSRRVPLFLDSAPREAWRRLLVACRWARPACGLAAGGRAAARTK